MSFNQMMNGLRKKYKGKIVLMKTGAFYIAIGSDAVFLRHLLDLKCTCFSNYICKVGIPIASLNKYLRVIESFGYGYIVFSIDKQKRELHEEKVVEGKSHKEINENINKDILYDIIQRKVTDPKLLWLLREIIYSNQGKTGLAIRKLYITGIC